MNEADAVRWKRLERRVDGLQEAVDRLLGLLQTSAEAGEEDQVAASFRRFQQDADQRGRG